MIPRSEDKEGLGVVMGNKGELVEEKVQRIEMVLEDHEQYSRKCNIRSCWVPEAVQVEYNP